MQVDTNISNNLTPDEKEVFSIVREVVEKYTPSTQVFAVGGWVRDRLIGQPSDDIDLMTTDLSGEDFAKLVTKHLGIKDANVIKANPEASKHLTTSKAFIPLSSGKTQEIDFAQARSEIYEEGSRIPTIKEATPQEDALRRDLTINSLMYDIQTGQVIDHTGKGIKDLITGTIRTPLDPNKTFSDDPLRIFRTIRFSSRFPESKIDDKTLQAMMNPELREKIKQKVSKERIGQEFVKMLKGPNPSYALQLLKDTGLMQDIISEALKGTKYEGGMAPLEMGQDNPYHKLNVWEHTMQVVKNILEMHAEAEPEKRVTMTLSALMHDLGKLYYALHLKKEDPPRTSYHGHEEASAEMSEHILRYLKMEPYVQQVSGIAKMHMKPHAFTEDRAKPTAKALRKFIRKMGEESLEWLDVFNHAMADAYSKDVIVDPKIVEKYQNLERLLQDALTSLTPDEGQKIQPVLNGNEIMQALSIKAGPWMKDFTEFVSELRDDNPNISKEEAVQRLQGKYLEIESTIPDHAKINNITASSDSPDSRCSMHLFDSKKEDIENLLTSDREYEALVILKQLKDEYSNDEKVTRLIASSLFQLLLKSENYRDADLLDHIFTQADKNYFDAKLCPYEFGILVLLDTSTDEKHIEEIGERMLNMAPAHMAKVINDLPEDVYHSKIRDKFKKKIKCS